LKELGEGAFTSVSGKEFHAEITKEQKNNKKYSSKRLYKTV